MELRRSVNTKIWDDVWFSELAQEEKLIWLYLLTNSQTNMLGVYEISLKKICFDTGIDTKTLSKAFEHFQSDKKAKYNSGYVILYNWIKNQSYNPNMIKSAISDFHKLPSNIKMSIKEVFMNDLRLKNESLSKPLESFETLSKKEKEKENEKEDEIAAKHDKIFEKLYNDKKVILSISELNKRSIDEIRNHILKFRLSLISTKKYQSNYKECVEYFYNWIKYNPIELLPKNSLASNPPETFD